MDNKRVFEILDLKLNSALLISKDWNINFFFLNL